MTCACVCTCELRNAAAAASVDFDRAFAALLVAGLEHNADHPIAERYRAASNTVNHANRKAEAAALRNR